MVTSCYVLHCTLVLLSTKSRGLFGSKTRAQYDGRKSLRVSVYQSKAIRQSLSLPAFEVASESGCFRRQPFTASL